ncbi:MAG: TRAP transporter large permease [Aeoliella sp.]
MSLALLVFCLSVFLLLRIPIAYSLGLSALVYFLCVRPQLVDVLPQQFFAGMDSYALIALPLFILMGQLMNASGITQRLISLSMVFVGRFRGGLGLVNVVASMLFGGISGSSASDTASIGSVLIPEMTERGYPKEFSAGITVASSTMGMIIPPSIPMVIYAVTAQESVGKLFLGGLVPGLLIGIIQLILVYRIAVRRHYPVEQRRYDSRQVVTEIAGSIYVLIMPLFVVGAVVGGFATATESAAVGVLYAAMVGFLLTRQLSLPGLYQALRSSILISAKIMMIIAMSQVFIWVLAYERVPETIAGEVASWGLSPTVLMLFVAVIVLAAGTFIDVSPAILLLTPVFLPTVTEAGVSPILFGVMLVSGLAVGACTPPVGNCLNVCAAVSGLRIGNIFRGAWLFLLANVVVIVVIILVPQLVLWIPNHLME